MDAAIDLPRLAANLAEARRRIAAAARASGRAAEAVTLVAVTKSTPPAALLALADLGVTHIGENRVQEATDKVACLGEPRRAAVHLIGHLQSNKAARARALFDAVDSVDTPALARRLDAAPPADGRPAVLPVLLEVNTSGEASKHGLAPEALPAALDACAGLPRLAVRGLMTLATGGAAAGHEDTARACFTLLADLASLHARRFADPDAIQLSMGMSADYEVAIRCGATHVRLGSCLFAGVFPRPGGSPVP